MRIENFFSPPIKLKTTREKHINGDFYSYIPKEEKKISFSPVNFYASPVKKEVDKVYIKEVARKKAEKYGVPLNIVLAIIEQESGFNPKAYNKNRDGSEDIGLMQINYKHNKRLMEEYGISSPEELYDVELNVELGVRILKENYERFGSWELAIKAYNGIRADNWGYVKRVLEKAKKYKNLG
ncbi:lytic transglycosylase domain-containing protein [Aquifex pyrophilus]